jgi:hypothetical protein
MAAAHHGHRCATPVATSDRRPPPQRRRTRRPANGSDGGVLLSGDHPDPAVPPNRLADRFGLLLGAVVLAVGFTMSAPDTGWGLLTAIGLQAGVLVIALRIAVVSRRLLRSGIAVAVALVALTMGAGVAGWDGPAGFEYVLGAVLVLAAIAAIVARLGSRDGGVDGRTVLGAVCVYLLLSTLFTFAFGAVAAQGGFFASDEPATLASLQYFSLATLTTVGYGDLAAAARLGRSLAVIEALLGQIYLVTVVALLVGRLGPSPRRPAGG